MADYVTKIRTESGDKQIDYNALANKPTLKSLGAAPAGFGLGTYSFKNGEPTMFTDSTKLDDLRVNGYWAYQREGYPLESSYKETHFVYGYTVASGDKFVTQRAITCYTGVWIERSFLKNKNAWTPWAYINPPMAPGVVYRTTEKINDKFVYKKKDKESGIILCSTDEGSTWKDQAEIIGVTPLTYELTQSGNTITLKGSDDSTTSVDIKKCSLGDLGITVTADKINYVDGVESNIQTQLNGKSASDHEHKASDIISGTLPIARGGTGASNGATGLANLFAAGRTKLSSNQYGDDFPKDYKHSSSTKGTIFFKKVSS